MPKIDLADIPEGRGSRYPAPFDAPCEGRRFRRIGAAFGLGRIGVNLVTLEPGAWSSQRHWHALEDEFVYVVSGEMVLVEDDGETIMRAGDCAAWKAGVRNGHHLQNRTRADAVFLVVANHDDGDHGEYPDIDMKFLPARYAGDGGYVRKDGTPYEPAER